MQNRNSNETIVNFNDHWIREFSKEVSRIYQVPTIKRKGQRNGHWHSEILAEYLLKKKLISKLDMIEPKRERPYKINYYNTKKYNLESPRAEENFAKMMSGNYYKSLGRFLVHQLPLKNHNNAENKGIGKIDLISYNDFKNQLNLVELKLDNRSDTLLRTLLEIETYYRFFDLEKFNESIKKKQKEFGKNTSKIITRILNAGRSIKIAKIIFANESCLVVDEFRDKNRKWVHKLLKDLDIEIIILKTTGLRLRIIKK
jgi:hypothetical protein